MPSLKQRRFRKAIVEAELAGQNWFWGAPCKEVPEHIEDKTTKRDTIRRTCCLCDVRDSLV